MTTQASATAAANPQQELDLRSAARHLARHPLVLAENDPEMLALIRRHEHTLDGWFTRRFGYRLQVTADSARLFKSSVVASRRPLLTATSQSRPFSRREYVMLALSLAAVAAGPTVISLRDLIHEIRSGAADAGIDLTEEASDRRALVTALRWMIRVGIASEMHEHIDRYVSDEAADAVLRIRPDRVALLPLPVLARSETAAQLLDRSDQRLSSRAWMRSMLLEEPVLYRTDLADGEWAELRQRLGEEAAIFEDMFGLRLESRAEGVMAIDPDNEMTDSSFPRSGTTGHAALLLLDRLTRSASTAPPGDQPENSEARRCGPDEARHTPIARDEVVEAVAGLAYEHRRYWSQSAHNPERFTNDILELLCDHRLVEVSEECVWLLPSAWRYSADVQYQQESLL